MSLESVKMSDTSQFARDILSMIRKDILGEQAMSFPFSKEEWPYQVDVLDLAKTTDILKVKRWCENNLKQDEWAYKIGFYAFKTQKVYLIFKLVWE